MSSLISKKCDLTNSEVSFWVDEFGGEMLQARDAFLSLGLGVTNISITLERHIFPEYRRKVAIGVGQPAWFLTYEGLVQLVMTTNSEKARSFQRWVFNTIKTIIKTGSYTATASDQQHLKPFGITLKLKIDECDRYIESAQPTADIAKVLRNRKALAELVKEESGKIAAKDKYGTLIRFIEESGIKDMGELQIGQVWALLLQWFEDNQIERADGGILALNQVHRKFLSAWPSVKVRSAKDHHGNKKKTLNFS
jgi:prophage antirepressor-like protein